MNCNIKKGEPSQKKLTLFRNSGEIVKRTIVWKSLDRTYVIKVPPDIFFDRTSPDECLLLIDRKNDGLVLVKPDAELGGKIYEIFDPSVQLSSDTPPEIIVSDEGPVDKRKKTTAGRKRAKVAKKAASKNPPVEKSA